MVHRLKNWILLRDIMCSNHREAKFLIVEAYKEMTKVVGLVPTPPINEDIVSKMINNLGCVISQDGFEAGLTLWRQDLSQLFKCPGECYYFEEFLGELDRMLQNLKETMSEKHQLQEEF